MLVMLISQVTVRVAMLYDLNCPELSVTCDICAIRFLKAEWESHHCDANIQARVQLFHV